MKSMTGLPRLFRAYSDFRRSSLMQEYIHPIHTARFIRCYWLCYSRQYHIAPFFSLLKDGPDAMRCSQNTLLHRFVTGLMTEDEIDTLGNYMASVGHSISVIEEIVPVPTEHALAIGMETMGRRHDINGWPAHMKFVPVGRITTDDELRQCPIGRVSVGHEVKDDGNWTAPDGSVLFRLGWRRRVRPTAEKPPLTVTFDCGHAMLRSQMTCRCNPYFSCPLGARVDSCPMMEWVLYQLRFRNTPMMQKVVYLAAKRQARMV